jgi:hypothetical protein
MLTACCAVICFPLIVATMRFGSCCATASGPLTFNPPVDAGPDAWLLDGEEVLVGGGLGGGEVVCAHASMPQESTASKDVQLFIQEVRFNTSNSSTRSKGDRLGKSSHYCGSTYAFLRLEPALVLAAALTWMLLITRVAPAAFAIRVADPLCCITLVVPSQVTMPRCT